MDPLSISLIATTVVTTISALVAVFRKNIRRSTCFGNTIEFRGDNYDATTENRSKNIFSRSFRATTPPIVQPTVPKPPMPSPSTVNININANKKDKVFVAEC